MHNDHIRHENGQFGENYHSEATSPLPDEYAIDAVAFSRALRDQHASGMKGGIYHVTQIQMSYNSNRIEGSSLSEEQTRYLYETQTIVGDNVSFNDATETSNHFVLFNAMMERIEEPTSAEKLRLYHRILKTGTKDALSESFAVGDWKRAANFVGGHKTTPPSRVEGEIEKLIESTPTDMSFNDIADWHVRFERIHPFQDGNGRVGRMVMFEQCLQNGIMPFVIRDQDKHFYYRGLAEYDDEPGFLRDTLRSSQDVYHDQFRDAIPR